MQNAMDFINRVGAGNLYLAPSTGLLLGWKKNTGDLLGSKTYKGTTTELKEWLPLSQLQGKAEIYLKNSFLIQKTTKNLMEHLGISLATKGHGVAKGRWPLLTLIKSRKLPDSNT